MKCPICETGTLTPSTWSGVFLSVTVTDLECSLCDTCGADPILTDQILRNQKRIGEVRRALRECAWEGLAVIALLWWIVHLCN